MTSDGIEFRVFQDGDEVAINNCFNRVHNSNRSLERWAFEFPVAKTGRAIVVALREEEILAQAAGVATRVVIEGTSVDALPVVDAFALDVQTADNTLEPLLERTLRAFADQYGGTEGFPLIFMQAGATPDTGMSGRIFGERLDLSPAALLSRATANVFHPRRFFYRGEACRDWEPRLDDFWKRVGGDYPTAIARDAEFVLHRYAADPTKKIHCFVVLPRFSSRVVAFAAFQLEDDCCRWVDLAWDHEHPGALDLLTHLSGRLAAQMGVNRESLVLGGDARGLAHLESSGFEAELSLDDLSLRVLFRDPDRVPNSFPEALYLTEADLEPI